MVHHAHGSLRRNSLDDQPRILPMWFRWDGSSVWMETSPTFRNYEVLRQNVRAAVAIDESLGGLRLRAVIMCGSVPHGLRVGSVPSRKLNLYTPAGLSATSTS